MRSHHWRAVEETFEKIVGSFPSYDNVSASLQKEFPKFRSEALLLDYMDNVLDGVRLDLNKLLDQREGGESPS